MDDSCTHTHHRAARDLSSGDGLAFLLNFAFWLPSRSRMNAEGFFDHGGKVGQTFRFTEGDASASGKGRVNFGLENIVAWGSVQAVAEQSGQGCCYGLGACGNNGKP